MSSIYARTRTRTDTRTDATSPLERQPVLSAVLLAVAFVVVAAGMTLLLGAVTPGLAGKDRDLIVEIVLALFVVGIVAALRWRREVGVNAPSQWRHPALLVVPAVAALIPFAGGFAGLGGTSLVVLLVGYTANSIAEDGMFNGILPRVLRSKGLLWVVILSPLLFGLAHFGNILSRPDQSVAITAGQALGVFTGGIGLLAVRLATRSLIPVMILHGASDLILQLGGFPLVLASVIQSILLLVFGIWVLRWYRRELAEQGWG
jgi:hypothetical protein